MTIEEEDASTNLSSKEVSAIFDKTYASNQSHNSIGIIGIIHCPTSKAVNNTITDKFFCAPAVSVESSIGNNCQALFASSVTSIGLSPALDITYVSSTSFKSPASAVSHAIINNTRIGPSTASIGDHIDLKNKRPASFDPRNMRIGINCSALCVSHVSNPDHNFSASAVTWIIILFNSSLSPLTNIAELILSRSLPLSLANGGDSSTKQVKHWLS